MRNVPRHVKDVRSPVREAPAEASRRTGLSVSAAFAMIRKEIQELRRQTSRPQVEPAIFEQRLHELAAQIGPLQGATTGGDGASQDTFLMQLKVLLAQNLANLQQQVATTAADAISGPAESIRRDVASLKEIQASVDRRTQDTFEAVYGTIERIVDRLATIEEELRERNPGPAAEQPPPSPELPPADDDADWAGLPAVRLAPAPPEATGLASPQAAADEAWRMLRRPAILPVVTFGAAPGPLSGPEPDVRPLQRAERDAGLTRAEPRAAATLTGPFRATTARPMRPRGKAALLGVGTALLVLFAFTLTLDFRSPPAEPAGDPLPIARAGSEADQPDDEHARPAEPSPDQPPARLGGDINPPPLSDGAAPAAVPAGPAAATAAATPAADTTIRDVDVLMHSLLPPAQAGRDPWPHAAPPAGPGPAATPLPAAIGSKALVAAAQAGDPGAAYEIAIRYTQGRNAAADPAKAALWLAHAARAGLAPAEFRLASVYEKGIGVRKDVAEARRLYVAAAARGHAKAMHNLAVLYTRGIDGAADYGAAVAWFRKAAAYGTVDSQYNLGILYARGTGIERDLVESYKWFTLAARGGDKDAAHKRDEVAKALDPKQQESARASADAFVAVPQPDEAITVKAPAGGWDQVATATAKSRTPGRPERSPGK
jgi:localization factor PodJL